MALISDGMLELGDFPLERGGVLRNARIDYRVYGTVNDRGDNVVLFPHMYSGGVASLEHMIGAARPLDPTVLCIVVPGQFGNGVSTSPSMLANLEFPAITIGDDVRAQHRLLAERLGAPPLCLVVGYSMGAQQAYEWAVRYPDRVRRLATIGGTARTGSYAALLVDALAATLASGARSDALALHARLWSVLGVSEEVYRHEAWRGAGFGSQREFIRLVFDDEFATADPSDLICQLRKWQANDVARLAGGDLARALGRIRADTLVMPLCGDPFFPVADCAAEAALIRHSLLQPHKTHWGHYAFAGFDPADREAIDRALGGLLRSG